MLRIFHHIELYRSLFISCMYDTFTVCRSVISTLLDSVLQLKYEFRLPCTAVFFFRASSHLLDIRYCLDISVVDALYGFVLFFKNISRYLHRTALPLRTRYSVDGTDSDMFNTEMYTSMLQRTRKFYMLYCASKRVVFGRRGSMLIEMVDFNGGEFFYQFDDFFNMLGYDIKKGDAAHSDYTQLCSFYEMWYIRFSKYMHHEDGIAARVKVSHCPYSYQYIRDLKNEWSTYYFSKKKHV